MTTRLITWTNARLWLFGVLLSSAGMFLGYTLGSDTARLLGGEPGIWARLGKGLVWGGVIGGVQWAIVRAIGVLPLRFVVASAVGFAVGYPLGQIIQGILVHTWSLQVTGYWAAVAAFGLFLGVPQWWIIHQHVKRASLWIFFNVIGWVMTGVAWINFRPGDGLDAIVYGIVAGLGLVWVVRSQQRKVKTVGS